MAHADNLANAGSDTPVSLVDTEWLAERLGSDEIHIVDSQPDVHDYFTEHIPGAYYLNDKALRVPKNGIPAAYIPDEAMKLILGRVGIDGTKTTVVYTSPGVFSGYGDGLEQTMLAYTMARFGHNDVRILDGGLPKWKDEGRPLSQEYPNGRTVDFALDVRSEYVIEFDELVEIKDRDDVLLLDNRPPGIYKGRGPWPKQGHIPGAVNLPWIKLMTAENSRLLKSDDELHAIVEQVGASPEKTVICSCGTAREATAAFMFFKWYLGYPKVRVYEGSFTEWVHKDQPTVRGGSPYGKEQ